MGRRWDVFLTLIFCHCMLSSFMHWFGVWMLCPVLSLGRLWPIRPTRYSWHCGSAGKISWLLWLLVTFQIDTLYVWTIKCLKNRKIFKVDFHTLIMLWCCVSGPTWSKRFTRPNGICWRQSKQPKITHLLRHLNVLFDLMLLVSRACLDSEASLASPASLERQWVSLCLKHTFNKNRVWW